MAAKKDRAKYTIKFNETSLTHLKAMSILEGLPARGNANFIAEALVFYNDTFGFVIPVSDEVNVNSGNQNTRPAASKRVTMVRASKEKPEPVMAVEEECLKPEETLVCRKSKEDEEEPVNERLQTAETANETTNTVKEVFSASEEEEDFDDEGFGDVFAESLINGFNL